MPTAVYDASWITRKNRDVALSSFKNQLTSAVNAGTSLLRAQPNTQMAEVNTQANLGCANACATSGTTCLDNTNSPYDFRGGANTSGPTGPS